MLAVRADQLHLDFIGGRKAFEQFAEVDGRQCLRLAAGQHVVGVDIAVFGAMLFVFFGVVPVVGTAYVQALAIPAAAWVASIGVGALICAVLVANNLRDIPTDAAVGKRSAALQCELGGDGIDAGVGFAVLGGAFGEGIDLPGERLDRAAGLVQGAITQVCDVRDLAQVEALLKVVSHTPIEVEALQRFMDAHGWADIGREHIPAPERYYSWWSYRAADWNAADKGRRLDHIWATPDISSAAHGSRILRPARGWEQPSDHVPVFATFDV